MIIGNRLIYRISRATDEVLISIHIEKLEEGGYLATSEDLPGLVAQGRTMAETIEIAQDVARKLIESYEEHGDPLPSQLSDQFNGSTDIRIAVASAPSV